MELISTMCAAPTEHRRTPGRWLRGLMLLVSVLALVQTVHAQAARTTTAAVLHKEARENSPIVAEVPAGTELKLEWDKAVWVDLIKRSRDEITQEYVFGVFFDLFAQHHTRVWALLPSQEVDGQLWLPVIAPNKKKAWVRQEVVELIPGGEFSFSEPVSVLIPIHQNQVPRLREAQPPDVFNLMLQNNRSSARLRLWLILNPQGETKAVGLIDSSGINLLDRMVAGSAQRFKFDPVVQDGKPMFVFLVLQFEFS